MQGVNANLKYLFPTTSPVLTLTSSGTGGRDQFPSKSGNP